MTFTTKIKEEIANLDTNPIEAMCELAAFIRFDATFSKNTISLIIDNPALARRIYKFIKGIYGVEINITVRTQKRFKTKQLYILTIKERYRFILESLNIEDDGKKILPHDYLVDTDEEKKAFLRGIFLSSGSINDPANGSYHLEFNAKTRKEADYIQELLKAFNIKTRTLRRKNHIMIYIKQAEMISDLIKLFGAVNSLFYFEDIRIYRDHKNMVNRLNNCEIANQEKTIQNGLKQLNDISYIEQNDLFDLLDERSKVVINYRTKYPETSYQELAEIISLETEKPISKSGINHAFIRIRDLIKRHKEKDNS